MKEIGIYIHIPFCKQKCKYCDFASYCGKEEHIEKYIDCVKKEIVKAGRENKIRASHDLEENYLVCTIYIGGGSPSYVKEEYMVELMDTIRQYYMIKEDAEITIEINPGTSTKEKMHTYHKCGFNRLSIGLQAVQDRILKEIGRIHTYQEFKTTWEQARQAGFENINVDLMVGLPHQTFLNVKESVDTVLEMEPEHISIYSLIIEEGTPFWDLLQEGKLELPGDDIERDMYWYVKRVLEQNGYQHYEISNFAKEGKVSKHNSDCWDQKEYLGFGLAAHSYLDQIRYSNTESVEEYIENWEKHQESHNIILQETQTREDMKKEFMMLGLRKIEGVSITEFEEKFYETPIMLYQKELSQLFQEGLIAIDGDYIKLTEEGLDVANLVWEKFI